MQLQSAHPLTGFQQFYGVTLAVAWYKDSRKFCLKNMTDFHLCGRTMSMIAVLKVWLIFIPAGGLCP
jgi:hypothetical protein